MTSTKDDSYIVSKTVWGPVPDAPFPHSWQSLMEEALFEAKKAVDKGEIPVGALVVDDKGNILARGHNLSISNKDPSAHAEIVALRQAAQVKNNYRLLDCYLVVTLEPCMMCTGAIREARLKGVIFGAYDVRAGAVCSCDEGLSAPHLGVNTWHLGGILADQCKEILQDFFHDKRD